MITLRRAQDRGHFDFGWLDTRHTFSFGEYFDPEHSGFRALRVLNEDRVQPGKGFGTHSHRDMEILTWVISGALAHGDSLGTRGVIRPGEVQLMSAGTGIRHSETNPSDAEPVHFLQIWIVPASEGLPPRYDQKMFPEADLKNRLRLIAGPEAEEGAAKVVQDVKIYAARLDPGAEVRADLAAGRAGFLHVASGTVSLQGAALRAGDGARIEGEPSVAVIGETAAEILFFDLA
ncbi:pirin family protein [Geothrix sp. 21YS21S-4]|uniref:pirin family protein n=1 Tax=Geothrix sp. 21YS21S-4 TaxID=3068889 RepID=UPI0027B92756|nr:pirin family protein [Geothrix sp. 21YS21S-4]